MCAAPQPPDLSRLVIAGPLRCRSCAYELRGLAADGVCPECGLSLWESIVHTVDPASSRLPKLRNPGRVGDGMLLLATCVLAAALLMVARPMMLRIDAMAPSGMRHLAAHTPPILRLLAGLFSLAGLLAVWKLAPPRRLEPRGAVWRDLFLLSVGLVTFAAIAVSAWWLDPAAHAAGDPGAFRVTHWDLLLSGHHMAMMAAAIVGFSGLRGVFQAIGKRSREYRTARGGRQRVRDMVAAIVGIALGESLRLLAASAPSHLDLAWVGSIGTVVVWICVLMLLIGLSYLVLNAWWIRRSLRKPPPTLEQILLPAPSRETGMVGPDAAGPASADEPGPAP